MLSIARDRRQQFQYQNRVLYNKTKPLLFFETNLMPGHDVLAFF